MSEGPEPWTNPPYKVRTYRPPLRPKEVILYPIAHGGVLWILALALLELVPHAGEISSVLTLGVGLAILRSTLRGGERMPRAAQFLPVREFAVFFIKGLGATLAVLWPFTIIQLQKQLPEPILPAALVLVLFLAIFVFLFALPAALIALARGETLAESLTPALLKRLIAERGEKYREAAGVLCIVGFFLMIFVVFLNSIPEVGRVLGRAVANWFVFLFARAFGVLYLLPKAQRIDSVVTLEEPEEPAPAP
ncbi:MAG: hypothetical protein ABIT01_14520 [Thermoanaerobaculia bacterium]